MFKLNQLLEINEENSWMSGTNLLTPLKLNWRSESYKRNCLGFRNRKKNPPKCLNSMIIPDNDL